MAICFVYQRDLDFVKFKLDKNEFMSGAGGTKSGKIVNDNDLLGDYDNLEDWSKLILKEIFKKEPTQMELNL